MAIRNVMSESTIGYLEEGRLSFKESHSFNRLFTCKIPIKFSILGEKFRLISPIDYENS